MKHFTLLIAFMSITVLSFSQVTFSVSPGLAFNGGTAGYKIGKINPYAGIQYFGSSTEVSSTGKRYGDLQNKIEDYSESFKTNIKLYMPNVGVKFFISEKKKIRPYINTQFFVPIVKLDLEYGNDNNYINTDEIEKRINGIRMWAFQAGFGTEYFFDDNFSVGGEVGFRTFSFKISSEQERTIYDPETGDVIKYTKKTNFNLGFSNVYSKISLNYYF